jgi:hypothetical protein
MHNSTAHLTAKTSVERPPVTVALSDFLVALNDYLNSRYYATQHESAPHGNHPAVQNHAARNGNPNTLFADRLTGGVRKHFPAGRPDRTPGGSLKNSDCDIKADINQPLKASSQCQHRRHARRILRRQREHTEPNIH